MTDRKNRRRTPILLLILFGIGWIFVQGFFRWRAVSLAHALTQTTAPQDLERWRDLSERLAWYRPGDVDLTFRRAEYADQAGDSVAAAAILATVPDSAPEAARARYLEGLVHRNAFRLDDSERAFRQSIRLDPRFLEAQRALAGLLGVERRRQDQFEALWNWVKTGHGALEPLRLLGQSVVVIPPGTIDKSTDEGAILEKALAAESESRHIRPALARFLRNRGELDRATELLTQWLERHGDDTTARIELLATYVDAGETEAASLLAREIESVAPEDPDYRLILGDHHRNLGQWREAEANYRKAISLDARNPESCYRLAQVLQAKGESDAANALLERHEATKKLAETVAAVDPARPTLGTIMAAAEACLALRRTDEAKAWATEALRIERDNAPARAILKNIATETNGR